jgi:hypothetical protein
VTAECLSINNNKCIQTKTHVNDTVNIRLLDSNNETIERNGQSAIDIRVVRM